MKAMCPYFRSDSRDAKPSGITLLALKVLQNELRRVSEMAKAQQRKRYQKRRNV